MNIQSELTALDLEIRALKDEADNDARELVEALLPTATTGEFADLVEALSTSVETLLLTYGVDAMQLTAEQTGMREGVPIVEADAADIAAAIAVSVSMVAAGGDYAEQLAEINAARMRVFGASDEQILQGLEIDLRKLPPGRTYSPLITEYRSAVREGVVMLGQLGQAAVLLAGFGDA